MNLPILYIEFVINFLIILTLFINILLAVASVFKTKDYSIELILLGLISFFVLLGFHEFMQLTVTSYKLADTEAPLSDTIISEMFSLMASMLIFGVAIIKNKLQKIKLGSKNNTKIR